MCRKPTQAHLSCLRAFWLMKAVSRWLDTLLVRDLLAHFPQLQHAVQVIRSCTCKACMCMHLGNHSASSEVHNPHLETSCAPFGSCRASFKGRRAFRRIPVPARPHDWRFGGWAGQLNDFSAGHLNQINDIKSSSTILNLIQISFEYG